MLVRTLLVAAGVAGLLMVGPPAAGWADPEPAPPPIPNVNAYPPLNPVYYAAMSGRGYAFAGPPGIV